MTHSDHPTKKIVYEAANSLEAHILQGVLEQQGIPSEIFGEYLQGGVGELPAAGLVKIVVDEENYLAARQAIAQWEAQSPDETPSPAPQAQPSSRLYPWIIGLLIGYGAAYLFYHAPVIKDGIDYNGDGVADEKWTFTVNGRMRKVEIDRNLDGKIDLIYHYHQSMADKGKRDDDFDGVFETRETYRNGVLGLVEVDTTGNGRHDLEQYYRHGVLDFTRYLDPRTGKVLRVEHFHLNVLQHADVDTDRDGKLDTRYTYSPLGELITTESLVP